MAPGLFPTVPLTLFCLLLLSGSAKKIVDGYAIVVEQFHENFNGNVNLAQFIFGIGGLFTFR